MEITEFIIKACVIFNVIRMVATGPLQHWTYDMLDLSSSTSDPGIIDLQFEIVRLGRGHYGFSGFIDFKVDLYDNVRVRGTIKRRSHRAGPYTLFGMGIENQTLSDLMNVYYKPVLQADLLKCCDNAPNVVKKFKAPLTKRFVTVTNCSLSNDNMPNVLMEGYYRMRVLLSGPVDMSIEALSLVETKMF